MVFMEFYLFSYAVNTLILLCLIFVLDALDKSSALVLITIPIMLKLLNEFFHSAYCARKTAIVMRNGVSHLHVWFSVLGVSSRRGSL